jgi:hypothetical protein
MGEIAMKEYRPFKFQPVKIDGLTFKQVEYHRNGIAGDGFYCAVAKGKDGDMLITYFLELGQCACAVYKLDLLPDITFGVNSWRGDNYETAMKKAIEYYNIQYDMWLEKINKISAEDQHESIRSEIKSDRDWLLD